GTASPWFRPYRQGLAAKAPGFMLLLGLCFSVSAHVGLGYAVRDQSFGRYDPDALARDDRPVRVKRATFDQIVSPSTSDAGVGEPAETADSLAEALLDSVEAQSSDVFDPELELRQVPEPLPRAAEVPVSADDFDLDELLTAAAFAPEEIAFDEDSAFDAERSTGAGSDELTGDLLSRLTAADGGLPAVGLAGLGGEGIAAGGGLAAAGDAGFGPGARGSAVAGGVTDKTSESGTESSGGGGGIDFLDFGAIDPADFEPPERLDEDFDYRVTRYEAPGALPSSYAGYFRVDITGKRSLRKLATMPKDVVFMVDTSASIPERTIKEITKGIGQSIRAMNDDDRFNLVFFSDQVRTFAGEPVPPTWQNLESADRWLRGARARGQTDVNLALRQLLRRDLEPGRVYELILISDGRPTLGVLDTRELINLITRENDLAASIYCVAVGEKQDNRLLDFLAYRNKGFSITLERRRDIALGIVELMSRLRYPIITDVQVRFAGQGMGEVYPLTLPNIHQSESFAVFGRYTEAGPFTVQVTGRSAGKPTDLTFRADLNDAAPGSGEVARGWGFWKLHHLYSEIIRLGEREDLLREISGLRQRYQLETLY
ncbi:MAG: VWA domain-containing protein, partial [Planctomycetota bacterium]